MGGHISCTSNRLQLHLILNSWRELAVDPQLADTFLRDPTQLDRILTLLLLQPLNFENQLVDRNLFLPN